jgi:tRNA dimethylallyltransferase
MQTIVVTGPTCSGKGAVAHALAQLVDGEVISLDSMKVYRSMNVGTAKPSESWRHAVPYHMIDLVDPSEEYSAGRYVREALTTAAAIHERGKHAIFAGGTPLYLWGLVRGFCPAPPGDPVARARLAERAQSEGLPALHDELARVDPGAAAKIHPHDRRRILRALEVHAITGKPFTEFWRNSVMQLAPGSYEIFGLSWPREELYRRINGRVVSMVEAGLIAEADAIAAAFAPLSKTVLQCIGYREVWEGRARGDSDEAMVARIQLHTRHFARKQGTWFRRFPEIRWIEVAGRRAADVAGEIRRTVC